MATRKDDQNLEGRNKMLSSDKEGVNDDDLDTREISKDIKEGNADFDDDDELTEDDFEIDEEEEDDEDIT